MKCVMKCDGMNHIISYKQYTDLIIKCDHLSCNKEHSLNVVITNDTMIYCCSMNVHQITIVPSRMYTVPVKRLDIIKELYCTAYDVKHKVYTTASAHMSVTGADIMYKYLIRIISGKCDGALYGIDNIQCRPFRVLWPWELQLFTIFSDELLELTDVSGITEHLLLGLHKLGLHRDLLMLVISQVIMISKSKYHEGKKMIFKI